MCACVNTEVLGYSCKDVCVCVHEAMHTQRACHGLCRGVPAWGCMSCVCEGHTSAMQGLWFNPS